jgi:hypothetical protein
MATKRTSLKQAKKKEKCQSCKVNEGEELHTCPFAADVNDDSESQCNCCDSCCGNCADAI